MKAKDPEAFSGTKFNGPTGALPELISKQSTCLLPTIMIDDADSVGLIKPVYLSEEVVSLN